MATITYTEDFYPVAMSQESVKDKDTFGHITGTSNSDQFYTGDEYSCELLFLFNSWGKNDTSFIDGIPILPYSSHITQIDLCYNYRTPYTITSGGRIGVGWGCGPCSGTPSGGLSTISGTVWYYEKGKVKNTFLDKGNSNSSYFTYTSNFPTKSQSSDSGGYYRSGSSMATSFFGQSGIKNTEWDDSTIHLYSQGQGNINYITLNDNFEYFYPEDTTKSKKGFIVKFDLEPPLWGGLFLNGVRVRITYETTGYNINLQASPSGGGTVSGGGAYKEGDTANITASPSSGYVFKNWTDNGTVVSSDSNYSFEVTKDRTLIANFERSLEDTLSLGDNGPFYLPATALNSFPTFNQKNCLKLKFIPPNSGLYIFSSSQSGSATTDPEAQLFSSDGGTSFGTGRDSGSSRHFNFTSAELIKGNTYYLMVGNWGGSSAAEDLYIKVEQKSNLLTVQDIRGYGGFLSISPSIGTHSYAVGESISFSVTPSQGYYVSGWSRKKETDTSWISITKEASGTYTMPDYDVILGVWVEKNNYTITAQSSNTSYGTISNSGGTYSYDSTFTSKATPINANYQFDGWYRDGSLVTSDAQLSEKVYGDATYIAQFSRKQYTITYVSDGGTAPDPQKFYAGDSVTLAPAIQKDSTITNPSYDFTTYFYKQGGVWGNGETSINQIVYPKKETSYTFYRWRNNSTDYRAEGSYPLSGDITLTAVWTPSPSYTITAPAVSHNDSTDSRTITFHYNDGTNKTTTATSSNTTSYTLKGWYTSASGGDKKISSNGGSYSPDSGETLYAQWNSSSTDYSKVTFPTFSRDGYTLLGFATSKSATSAKYEAGQEVAVDSVDWYAVWSLDTFTLSYDVNGGSGTFSDQTGNVTYTIRSTRPTRIGYNFQGWALTKDAKTADYQPGGTITINKNTTLYAVWAQETISSETSKNTTISYAGQIYWYKFTPTTAGTYAMYSTGTADTYGYIYNNNGTSLDVDDDEGDSTNFRVSYSLSANTPYYFGVKYLNSSSTGTIRINLGPVYTISYNSNGGSTAPSSQSKDWNKSITLSSSTLTRDYYNFKGWSTTASDTEPDYNKGATFSTDANTILYAVWDPIDYLIEYKLNGGKVAVTNLTSYNVETNSFTLNNPTKDGHTFTGWSGTGLTGTNNKNVTIAKGSNGDRTYTANWKQNIYTVTLDNQSANTAGTTAIYLKYNSGWFPNNQATTSISKITIPQKNGHTFNGYYPQKDGAGGNPIIDANGNINFNSTSLLEDKTYYAYWTINYYSLTDNINTNGIENTYNGNYYSITQISGNKVNNKYSYGSKIRLIAMPNTSEGYNFSYWKINDSYERSQEYEYTIEKDTTITAYFNLGELSITINLYQEENPNIFNIPMGQEKDYVKLWIREYNNTSYNGWEQKPFNTTLSYEEAKHIQIVIEDGEKYEFLSSDFTQYESIPVNQALAYNVYFKEISEINSIYLGKSDKPYTSGYIDDPNLSFKEEISSIWVGNKQIMGKAPTRPYPYIIDTLLGDTLYIGLYNSVEDWKNGRDMKTDIPGKGNVDFPYTVKKLIMHNNITYIGSRGLSGYGFEKLTLSNNLQTLGWGALVDGWENNFNKIKKIYLPKSLNNIYSESVNYSMGGDTCEKIVVHPNNLNYSSDRFGVLYNKEKTILMTMPKKFPYDFYQIPFIKGEIYNTAIESSKIKFYYKGTKEQWNANVTVGKHNAHIQIYCTDGIIQL